MKRLKKHAILAGLMMAAIASQASTVTWDTVRTEGNQYASFTFDSVKYTAIAGAIVGNISGWGSLDGEYYAFCTDPLGAYVPDFEGTTSLFQGDLSTFLSYVYYGIRGVDDYASAQFAVWEIVTDVAQGFLPDYTSGTFKSGDTLAEGAIDLIERGKLLAATSPAVQFYNISPYDQNSQSFAISMQAQAVPEPATAMIVSLGLIGMWSIRRRRVS